MRVADELAVSVIITTVDNRTWHWL